jgi:2'-5' RNA ligase
LRLFVALELPEAVAGALHAWAPRDDALRGVPPASLHVTMAFLGERPGPDGIPEVLERVARPVGEATLRRPRWLGSVLAVELEAPGVVELQAALSDALDWEPDPRPFLPHVTVARLRNRRARRPRVDLPPLPSLPAFRAGPLTLFCSQLSPRGARYEPLAHASLDEA